MKVLKYPVIAITAFLALGIAANYYLKPQPYFVYAFTALAFILLLLFYRQSGKSLIQKPYFSATVYILAFCTGMLVHSLHYEPGYKSHYTHHLHNDEPVIKGVITERLKPNAYYEKYYFRITSLDKQSVSGRLLLTIPKDTVGTQLNAGDVIIAAAPLSPISGSLNPYQFDYSEYMARQNVFHQVRLKDNYFIAGQVKNRDYYLESFRSTLVKSFDKHNYNPETLNVIKALLLGQRQDMDSETIAAFTDAGVMHILAISGLHIGILFLVLSFSLKPLERMKKGKLLKFVLILAVLWLFALVSGLSASVVRAVLMFSIIGIGMQFNRRANIYNSIALSMLILLLAKPNFLFDIGFQLSYAAVLSIVVMEPLYRKIRKSKYKAVNYFTDLALVSLAAQIGVLPLSLYYFNQFPLLFLFANMVVIPLSTLVLILGIAVLALNFIYIDVAIVVGKLLEWLILAMNSAIKWIASFEGSVFRDIPFTLLLNLALYIAIIATVLWLYKKSYCRTTTVLIAALAFQVIYIATSLKAAGTRELVVFHNYGSTLVAIKNRDNIRIFSNDSNAVRGNNVRAYRKGSFNHVVSTLPLTNMLWYRQNKIFVLDSLGMYDSALRPDILLMTESPKVNLEKVLRQLKPKQVVADATNYKSYIARWKATCQKEKIPFHATAEKGFYRLTK